MRNIKITVLIHANCVRCEMKKDINWSKSCAENKHYFLKCNKPAWLCEAVEKSTNIPEVSWDRQNLMTRNVYMKIIEDIINEMEPRQAVLCVWKLNRDLTVLQPHMKSTCTLVEQNLMNRYIPWDMSNASFPLPPLGKELDDEYVPLMEPYYEPKQPGCRLPEDKKEVELYDEEGLDETGHKKGEPPIEIAACRYRYGGGKEHGTFE